MSSDPPRLFYFRHGETPWSLSGRHSSVTDVPLTENGERQARALRPWTAAISFAQVLTSPRLRARATCELAGLGGQAEIEPDLAEWNYGEYEGRHSAEIKQGRPGWDIFRDGCPNGELPDEIGARADRLIARLCALGGDVALFAHGQVGSVFVARWIGLATLEGSHFSVGPASMGVLSWDRDHPEIPVVALWNATPGVPA
jgi:probable phosphoglycerate mutase